MTSAALSRVQSRMSGVTETEQMRIKAVSIAGSNQVGSALLRAFVRRAVTRNSVCPTIFLDINKQYPGQYPWYLYSIRAQSVGLACCPPPFGRPRDYRIGAVPWPNELV